MSLSCHQCVTHDSVEVHKVKEHFLIKGILLNGIILLLNNSCECVTKIFSMLDKTYSVPFEVVQLLEELFSHPWLSLQSPHFHRSLSMVSPCPHNFFLFYGQKSVHLRQSNQPPLPPKVGDVSLFKLALYLNLCRGILYKA